jgi:hypothetical protein
MTYAQSSPSTASALSRSGELMLGWMRELEECRIGGLVTDEEYSYQRAEKFAALLRPTRCLWLASLLGMALVAAPASALIWFLTKDPQYAAAIGVLAGAWGLLALGRLLREKTTEFQLTERRNILVALLENDLLTVGEFADYDDRLAQGRQHVI